jgi:hypothetical protein
MPTILTDEELQLINGGDSKPSTGDIVKDLLGLLPGPLSGLAQLFYDYAASADGPDSPSGPYIGSSAGGDLGPTGTGTDGSSDSSNGGDAS